MTDAPEKPQATATAATASEDTTKAVPTSPARSDKSSDSEGKNVREKLKDTQIDAQATSDPGTSPKNKRTRDQVEKDTEASAEASEGASTNGKPAEKLVGDERDSKRLRDKEEVQPTTDATESKTKVWWLTLRD